MRSGRPRGCWDGRTRPGDRHFETSAGHQFQAGPAAAAKRSSTSTTGFRGHRAMRRRSPPDSPTHSAPRAIPPRPAPRSHRGAGQGPAAERGRHRRGAPCATRRPAARRAPPAQPSHRAPPPGRRMSPPGSSAGWSGGRPAGQGPVSWCRRAVDADPRHGALRLRNHGGVLGGDGHRCPPRQQPAEVGREGVPGLEVERPGEVRGGESPTRAQVDQPFAAGHPAGDLSKAGHGAGRRSIGAGPLRLTGAMRA